MTTDHQLYEFATGVMSVFGDPIPYFEYIPWRATLAELEDRWGQSTPCLELDWVDASVGEANSFLREVSGIETDAVAFVHPEAGLVMLWFIYREPKDLPAETPPKFLSHLLYAVWASHLATQFEGVVDCTSEEDCSVLIGEFQMGRVCRDQDIGTVGVTLGFSEEGDMADAPWSVVLSYTNTFLLEAVRDRASSGMP